MERCAFICSTVEPGLQLIDTQAFVMADRRIVITAFRGTEPRVLKDWLSDAGIVPVDGPNGIGRIHRGFGRALACVYDELKRTILGFADSGQSLWYTGHSLGAALAALMARQLQLETGRVPGGIYTFGQPRIGNADFAAAFDSDLKSVSFRLVNHEDIVPRLPPEALGYDHAGTLRYFDADGGLGDELLPRQKLRDRLVGDDGDTGGQRLEGFEDHGIGQYLKRLERLL